MIKENKLVLFLLFLYGARMVTGDAIHAITFHSKTLVSFSMIGMPI